jgi:hypothetical protein
MEDGVTESWKKYVATLTDDVSFGPLAGKKGFSDAENELGLALPDDLKLLLQECDGVVADYGAEIVWSTMEMRRRNQEIRSADGFRCLYMPFENLLFFGDDGGGDLFAFAVQANGAINRPDIFRWDHETDARNWFASDLRDFFGRRLGDGD